MEILNIVLYLGCILLVFLGGAAVAFCSARLYYSTTKEDIVKWFILLLINVVASSMNMATLSSFIVTNLMFQEKKNETRILR